MSPCEKVSPRAKVSLVFVEEEYATLKKFGGNLILINIENDTFLIQNQTALYEVNESEIRRQVLLIEFLS